MSNVRYIFMLLCKKALYIQILHNVSYMVREKNFFLVEDRDVHMLSILLGVSQEGK